MFHLELETDQCLHQSDCLLHVEISSLTGENFMGFLLDHEDEVSG